MKKSLLSGEWDIPLPTGPPQGKAALGVLYIYKTPSRQAGPLVFRIRNELQNIKGLS
jgi:hypothetical protein